MRRSQVKTRATGVKKKVVAVKRQPLRSNRSIVEKLRVHKGKSKICIIRSLGGIGDVLMATPLLRQLKKDFPNSELVFAIDRKGDDVYYQILKNCPFIDKFIDAKFFVQDDYDFSTDITTVCIRNEGRGLRVKNRIDIFASAVGYNKLDDPLPFYQVEDSELEQARSLLNQYAGFKFLSLHSASNDPQRCWPAENYIEFIKRLETARPDIKILLFDDHECLPGKYTYSNCIDLSNTSVREMAAYIKASDFFIGPDSGPMHLAGILGTPAIVLFGHIPVSSRLNYYPKSIGLVEDGICKNTWYEKCTRNMQCMKNLSAELIYNKLMEFI
jgi:ADP-heptose:LPS heptosyltransferase